MVAVDAHIWRSVIVGVAPAIAAVPHVCMVVDSFLR